MYVQMPRCLGDQVPRSPDAQKPRCPDAQKPVHQSRTTLHLLDENFPCPQSKIYDKSFKIFDLKKAFPEEERVKVKTRRSERLKVWHENNDDILAPPLALNRKNGKGGKSVIMVDPSIPIRYPLEAILIHPKGSFDFTDSVKILSVSNSDQNTQNRLILQTYFGILYLNPSSNCQFTPIYNKESLSKRVIFEKLTILELNNCLSDLTYEHTSFQPKGATDAVSISFNSFQPVFVRVEIKFNLMPVLFDYAAELEENHEEDTRSKNVSKNVETLATIVTKTFLRPSCLEMLLISIRKFYKKIRIIVADDSPLKYQANTQKLCEKHNHNCHHFVMPEYTGWNAGRNLVISQVNTEYVVWLDDDFIFTQNTRLELMFEFLEEHAYYDLVAGQLDNKDKSWGMFNRLHYDDHDRMEKDGASCVIHSKGFITDEGKADPQESGSGPATGTNTGSGTTSNYVCRNVDMTINFWMARTLKVRSIGFDNSFKKFAHKEFFIDGRGKLAIAQCGKPTVHHNGNCKQQYGNLHSLYHNNRYPSSTAWIEYLRRWYFRGNLDYLVEKSLLPVPHDNVFGEKDGSETVKSRFLNNDD